MFYKLNASTEKSWEILFSATFEIEQFQTERFYRADILFYSGRQSHTRAGEVVEPAG